MIKDKEHIIITDKDLGLLSHLSPLLNTAKFTKRLSHTDTQTPPGHSSLLESTVLSCTPLTPTSSHAIKI